jgi:DNA mismatch repair protein MutL
MIHVLDEPTINQIAAGEVVERPSAVVKELIENAMDAGATAITAEIKEGGLSFIRITDNGAGITKEDIPLAFLRHATSKIRTAQDLLSVTSLGFRGEALSSIAAVAQVELITKTPSSLNGFRYMIEGGEEKSMEEIGCPGGTTIIVRNLFFNTPARRKFLKSAMTETGYISDLMERLMVSHPGVSFKYIVNNQIKLQSSGNNSSKDILYHVYGRDISKELLPIQFHSEEIKIGGFVGKPIITRGNRNFENYFINGRYIKSNIITKAIEEAFKPFLMQHKYPFTSIYFEIDPSMIDVNVHPQKLEIRLKNGEEVYQLTYNTIRTALLGKEMIPRVTLIPEEENKNDEVRMPEPFEENRRKQFEAGGNLKPASNTSGNYGYKNMEALNIMTSKNITADSAYRTVKNNLADHHTDERINSEYSSVNPSGSQDKSNELPNAKDLINESSMNLLQQNTLEEKPTSLAKEKNYPDYGKPSSLPVNNMLKEPNFSYDTNAVSQAKIQLEANDRPSFSDQAAQVSEAVMQNGNDILSVTEAKQINLFEKSEASEEAPFLSKKALEEHRIIGQVFSTYWLVEYKKELYIIDQHAAHEKVLFERIMSAAKTKTFEAQQLLPPIVLTLTLREQEVLQKNEEALKSLGYEFEHFGGNEYSVRAVPSDLYGISEKDLLLEFIDEMAEDSSGGVSNNISILERVASLSCKAAVKANHTFSYEEAAALIKELLTLENPYHCPHGRPVIVSMSQYELERKFKRIV